jgi:hypothetical protein
MQGFKLNLVRVDIIIIYSKLDLFF